jgi:hypothetical protein
MAARWAEILGCRAERSGETWRIGLRDSELSFTNVQDERSEGLRAINVVASDARATRDTVERRSLINGEGYVILCGTGSPGEPLTEPAPPARARPIGIVLGTMPVCLGDKHSYDSQSNKDSKDLLRATLGAMQSGGKKHRPCSIGGTPYDGQPHKRNDNG